MKRAIKLSPISLKLHFPSCQLYYMSVHQAPVVQKLDNAIHRISVNKTNHAIRWIVIYPVDSDIQPLNNWGLVSKAGVSQSPPCMQRSSQIQIVFHFQFVYYTL